MGNELVFYVLLVFSIALLLWQARSIIRKMFKESADTTGDFIGWGTGNNFREKLNDE